MNTQSHSEAAMRRANSNLLQSVLFLELVPLYYFEIRLQTYLVFKAFCLPQQYLGMLL